LGVGEEGIEEDTAGVKGSWAEMPIPAGREARGPCGARAEIPEG